MAPKTSPGKPINRRRLLQKLAATGVTAIAGCIGSDNEGGNRATQINEIEAGGTLRVAIERQWIDHFDPVSSLLADDAMIFDAAFDGFQVSDTEGQYYNWMAREYEVVDARDVEATDYEPYMEAYEIVDIDEEFPLFDIERPNLVLIHHPEDMVAVAEGDLKPGDMMRLFTREEAAEAAADGVYGSLVRAELHEGIEFHDGTECTAGDVVGSYDRFVGSIGEGHLYNNFLHAEAPEGDDGYVVEMYAQMPDATADTSLPPFQIFPETQHDYEPGELNPLDGGPAPVGTGPYEFADWSEGSSILLTRTDDYWLEEVGLDSKEWWDGPEEFPEGPVIDEIEIRFVPEADTRVAALSVGDIDVSYELGAGDRTAFDQDPDFTVNAAPSAGFKFLQMPLKETEQGGALASREVRHAINSLVPREDIVEVVDEGWGVPAQLPFPEPAALLATHSEYDEYVEEVDWSYPTVPDVEAAKQYIEESPHDPPIELVLETNADDEERQDKVQLIVDELNTSGLFDATIETPADIIDWTTLHLYAEGSHVDYAQRNAGAIIGLTSGFDPHASAEAVHHPDNFNICCNFFFPSGTFDFIDLLDGCRFGPDVAEDEDTRRDRYEELWPVLAETLANTMIDFGESTNVAGPRVNGYAGYPTRAGFLSYSIYAPYDDVVAWIEEDAE